MSTLIDLEPYFRRIGYDGERSATLATRSCGGPCASTCRPSSGS